MKHLTKINALYWLILIFTMTTAISCSENEKDKPVASLLTGTWDLTYIEMDGIKITAASAGINTRLTFYSDDTWAGHATGTGVNFGGGTYTLSGHNLTFREQGAITMYGTIISLTQSQLVLDLDYDNYIMTWTFTRFN